MYKYLKSATGVDEIKWPRGRCKYRLVALNAELSAVSGRDGPMDVAPRNFASYFLVSRSGSVQHLPGGRNSPATMRETLQQALQG